MEPTIRSSNLLIEAADMREIQKWGFRIRYSRVGVFELDIQKLGFSSWISKISKSGGFEKLLAQIGQIAIQFIEVAGSTNL